MLMERQGSYANTVGHNFVINPFMAQFCNILFMAQFCNILFWFTWFSNVRYNFVINLFMAQFCNILLGTMLSNEAGIGTDG
ncbi:unnamed protein product, partial [Urochloa humidicola]